MLAAAGNCLHRTVSLYIHVLYISVVKAETCRGHRGATRALLHDADTKTKNYIINKGLLKYGKKNVFSISINERLKIINCF